MSTTEENSGASQALAQIASVCAMVAALQCDYDRLQKLRDERSEWNLSDGSKGPWEDAFPSEAEELAKLEHAAGECDSEDEARQRIEEDALSVEVRSGWQPANGDLLIPAEFRIVLCTGGPHVELLGELDDNNEPDRVRVRYSDWGTSGEVFDFDRDAVLAYCRCFYFGE